MYPRVGRFLSWIGSWIFLSCVIWLANGNNNQTDCRSIGLSDGNFCQDAHWGKVSYRVIHLRSNRWMCPIERNVRSGRFIRSCALLVRWKLQQKVDRLMIYPINLIGVLIHPFANFRSDGELFSQCRNSQVPINDYNYINMQDLTRLCQA